MWHVEQTVKCACDPEGFYVKHSEDITIGDEKCEQKDNSKSVLKKQCSQTPHIISRRIKQISGNLGSPSSLVCTIHCLNETL